MPRTSEKAEIRKELIDIVDKDCRKKRFTPRDEIVVIISFVVFLSFGLILIYYVSLIGYNLLNYAMTLPKNAQLSFLVGQSPSFAALGIAVLAIIVSYPSKFRFSSKEDLADWYFGELVKKYATKAPFIKYNEKPFLKALIKMKCAEFQVSLVELYGVQDNRWLFSKKALLGRLYEPSEQRA